MTALHDLACITYNLFLIQIINPLHVWQPRLLLLIQSKFHQRKVHIQCKTKLEITEKRGEKKLYNPEVERSLYTGLSIHIQGSWRRPIQFSLKKKKLQQLGSIEICCQYAYELFCMNIENRSLWPKFSVVERQTTEILPAFTNTACMGRLGNNPESFLLTRRWIMPPKLYTYTSLSQI